MASLCETRGACSGATRASIQAGTIFASSKPRAIVAKFEPTAPVFKWVNAALGTIKSALARTYRVVRQKHVARYLAEFGYHFNRKYKLEEMIPRLAFVALMPAHSLPPAKAGCRNRVISTSLREICMVRSRF